jgi:hypothetical protein
MGGVVAMANPVPNINFNSPWPGRLKALKKDESILISKDELSNLQVRALVSNMNYRWKGELLFSAMGTPDTDTIVTCLFKGRNVVDDRRKVKSSKSVKKPAPPTPAPKTTPAVSDASSKATHYPAIALIEATLADGNVRTYRAIDKDDYDNIMAGTANDTTIVQIQTFVLTHTKKRDYSWKDETSPLKG